MDKGELTSLPRIDEEYRMFLVLTNLGLDRREILGRTPDFASEEEGTSFSIVRLDPHVATHEIDEFFRYGQAQACAAKPSCC